MRAFLSDCPCDWSLSRNKTGINPADRKKCVFIILFNILFYFYFFYFYLLIFYYFSAPNVVPFFQGGWLEGGFVRAQGRCSL